MVCFLFAKLNLSKIEKNSLKTKKLPEKPQAVWNIKYMEIIQPR